MEDLPDSPTGHTARGPRTDHLQPQSAPPEGVAGSHPRAARAGLGSVSVRFDQLVVDALYDKLPGVLGFGRLIVRREGMLRGHAPMAD